MSRNPLGTLSGVKITESALVPEGKMVVLGKKTLSPYVPVKSNVVEGAWLPVTRQEFTIVDLATGNAWGDKIDFASEVMVTEEHFKSISHYITETDDAA